MEFTDTIAKTELAERQQISRKNIIEHLQLLSSVEQQLEYQHNVPYVNIANELVCMWFDNNYHPEDKIFRSAFLEAELQAMSNFSREFDNVLAHFWGEQLPSPEIADLVKTPEWAELTQAAQKVLQVLENHTDK